MRRKACWKVFRDLVRVGRILEWRLRGLGVVWNARVEGAVALGSCLRQVVRAKGLR